ncbi:MAG: Asp-tRNA(Asn)/Glu-tRNA(Gln) amidotransferase subunit GatA [Candidatus Micrarchaeia archaeon]
MRTLKEHIEAVKSGSIDLADFSAKVVEEAKRVQAAYAPFISVAESIKFEVTPQSLLPGVPVAVKDNICTKGMRTTAGSKILENYVPPFDATVVEKVKKEGAGIVGKTAMDEFGFGTFSTNCAFGVPKNPLDPERSCGGSSGGSAGAVAAFKLPIVSIAESTGGSITCPAAFTGTVGITPTYGLVSRWGLIDYANSLDKIGTIGKSVYDAALLLSAIAGYDEKDATSLRTQNTDYAAFAKPDGKKLRIGLPEEYFSSAVDSGIIKEVERLADRLNSLGFELERISLPSTELAIPTYYIISMSEASTNLAKFSGLRYGLQLEFDEKQNIEEYFTRVRTEGFGEEAKRRIILGTFTRMAGYKDRYYLKALKIRKRIINEFKQAFAKVDVLLAPSMPIMPPKFSEIEKLEPAQVYMMDILTVAPNMAGMPTVALPIGHINGLPVSVQVIADHLQEGKAIQMASIIEGLNGR